MKNNQQALWSCSPCNIAVTLIPRGKVKDTQGLLFFLSYQDLWIVMAASFSSQDKRIPPPLLPLEVLPFSQSVTKKVNEMIIHVFHHFLNSNNWRNWLKKKGVQISWDCLIHQLCPNSIVLVTNLAPVMFSKNDLLRSSFLYKPEKSNFTSLSKSILIIHVLHLLSSFLI